MKIIAALLLLIAPLYAHADWSQSDTRRQTAVTALLVIDWGQTRYIAKHLCPGALSECPPDRFLEVGFAGNFIGERPTIGRVNNYFAASIVGHAAIAYALPPEWRRVWQYVFVAVETFTVARNRSLGVKIDF